MGQGWVEGKFKFGFVRMMMSGGGRSITSAEMVPFDGLHTVRQRLLFAGVVPGLMYIASKHLLFAPVHVMARIL